MRILLVTLTAVILVSCSGGSDGYKLTGTAVGFDEGEKLFWQKVDKNNQPVVIDTLIVQGGKIQTPLQEVDYAEVRLITDPATRRNHVVFTENVDVKVALYKDSMYASRSTGGRENALYTEYNNTIKEYALLKRQKMQAYQKARMEQDGVLMNMLQEENNQLMSSERAFKQQFVKDNPNSVFTLIVLSELVDEKQITATDARKIVENTKPEILETSIGVVLQESLESMKNIEIGGKAPEFEAPSPSGDVIALADVKSKYTLIDFWASWCKPCRYENPNLVKLYNEYHDDGFNIIGVSLDQPNGKARWEKAIADDGLPWPQISNLKFWQDPIARMYNVHAIPASFLLDENGIIVARDLRGAQLEAKLAQLFTN